MPRQRLPLRPFAGLLVAVWIVGCGGSASPSGESPLTVAAASSLTEAFEAYGRSLPGGERFSFGASSLLAAQVRQGAAPDLYAGASPAQAAELEHAGLVGRPVRFADNQLVVAVPNDSKIRSVGELAADGVDVVLAAEGVPAGDYAARALARLPRVMRAGILSNVRSREPDVKGVVGKLTQGAADAGFTYLTDVVASSERLRAVGLRKRIAPAVEYTIAPGVGTGGSARVKEFIAGLLDGDGAEALAAAGFEPPG